MEVRRLSVVYALRDLKEPRSRGPERALIELVVVAIAAILSGSES